MLGDPICVRTLSSHCRGPLRCSSIQQGVLVTVWRLQGTEEEVLQNKDYLVFGKSSQPSSFSQKKNKLMGKSISTFSAAGNHSRLFPEMFSLWSVWCQKYDTQHSQSSGNPLAVGVQMSSPSTSCPPQHCMPAAFLPLLSSFLPSYSSTTSNIHKQNHFILVFPQTGFD